MKNLIKLRFVLFDFDGVLVDSIDLHTISTLKAIEKGIGAYLDSRTKAEIIKVIKSSIGKSFDEIVIDLEKIVNIRIENPEKIKLLKREIFLENLDKISVLPCVYSTLGYLKEELRGIHVGVASFASRLTLNQTLEYKDLRKYFDVVVSLEDFSQFYKKGDKKLLYAMAIKEMGCEPYEGIVIGDTPLDITSGRELGTLAIGVTTGVYTREDLLKAGAYKVFNNLCEFLEWIKGLI